jgi:hypothetical protein
MTVKIGSKRIEFEKGKATFFRGSGDRHVSRAPWQPEHPSSHREP